MAEYSASANQIVATGAPVIFTDAPDPCKRGLVRHRDDSGNFLLSGKNQNSCCCGCGNSNVTRYLVEFGANISVPSTGTAGPISLAIMLDGTIIPSSEMIVTPTAVDAYFNVSRSISIPIWNGCCENISIVNTSDQAIQVEDANIIITL